MFKSIYKTFIYRTELVNIFKKYSTSAELLLSEALLEFLQTELCESCASTQRVSELVHKYEKNHEGEDHLKILFGIKYRKYSPARIYIYIFIYGPPLLTDLG